jgi:alpha-1,4-digalacturonate transport system permease protein
MASVSEFLTRTRGAQDGSGRLHWTDWASYGYLTFGIFLMFGPVVWLVMSSFKTEADLQRYPPPSCPTSSRPW